MTNLDTLALSLCPSLDWDKHNWVEGFKAGVAAAGNNPDILQAILQPFAEWFDKHGWVKTSAGHWLDYKDNHCTLEQVFAKYIQFITDKQKNNEQGNKV